MKRRDLIIEDHLPQEWRFGLIWRGVDEPALWSVAACSWLLGGALALSSATLAHLGASLGGLAPGLFLLPPAACLLHAARRARSTVVLELNRSRLRVADCWGRTCCSIERPAIRRVSLVPARRERFSIVLMLDHGREVRLPFEVELEMGHALGHHLWSALQELRSPTGYRA